MVGGHPELREHRLRVGLPGYHWVFCGNQSRLEYDFHVAPGANPGLAKLRFDDGDLARLDADGDLLIESSSLETHYLRPVVYQ